MLMTRVIYLTFVLVFGALNSAALWALSGSAQTVNPIVPAALIINTLMWPIALVVAYRIGQVTGVEYFRKVRARASALRASLAARRL